MNQNEYELLILRKVRTILHKWVGSILLICTLYTFAVYKQWVQFFELTEFLKESTLFTVLFVVILASFSFMLSGEENKFIKKQFRYQILISVCILSLVVFISGGLLDSPFTGAIAFFVGSFISFQSDDKVKDNLRLFNLFLIVVSVVMLVMPYIISDLIYGKASFISWNNGSWISYMRIIITVLLLIITGYAASKINKEITSLQPSIEDDQ